MTPEERTKGQDAVDFFIKQHDDDPRCPMKYPQCGCTFSWTLNEIVAWWKKKLATEGVDIPLKEALETRVGHCEVGGHCDYIISRRCICLCDRCADAKRRDT